MSVDGFRILYDNEKEGNRHRSVLSLLYYANIMQSKYPGKCHQMALLGFSNTSSHPTRMGAKLVLIESV